MATSKPSFPPDYDYGWKLEVGTTVTFLLAAMTVALRTFSRIKYSKKGWDDYLMVFAVAQALVATILDFVAVNWGLGRHINYLTLQEAINQEYYSLLAQVFCVQALTFAKLSIILSYLRILRGSASLWQQVLLWTVGILTFVINTLVILTFYVGCSPTAKSWDPLIPGTCWPVQTKVIFVLLQGAWSAFSDLFLALFPIAFLSKLQVNKRTKFIIMILMGLGTVTGIFAIVRTAEAGTQLNLPVTKGPPDVSFSTVEGLMWSGMERNIAIMVGSVPALRPLVPPMRQYLSQSWKSSRYTGQSSTYRMDDGSKFRKQPGPPSGANATFGSSSKKSMGDNSTTMSREQILPFEHI